MLVYGGPLTKNVPGVSHWYTISVSGKFGPTSWVPGEAGCGKVLMSQAKLNQNNQS